jgi:hypothetical protein
LQAGVGRHEREIARREGWPPARIFAGSWRNGGALSDFADIFEFDYFALQFFSMSHTFENVLHQVQPGEDLIASAVDELISRWQASVTVIGKLCAETDRWQAVIRQMQAPVNLADILRARAIR